MRDNIYISLLALAYADFAARALARTGREVTILESESLIGSHTSSRNSEVIHEEIYYPPGSRKARLCVEGRSLLSGYCDEKGIPHSRIGKLVVAANDDDIEAVRGYLRKTQAKGGQRPEVA